MKIEGKPFSAFDAAKLPGGLVPAVIQDDRTLQVLMLGYMNREAYEDRKSTRLNSSHT